LIRFKPHYPRFEKGVKKQVDPGEDAGLLLPGIPACKLLLLGYTGKAQIGIPAGNRRLRKA